MWLVNQMIKIECHWLVFGKFRSARIWSFELFELFWFSFASQFSKGKFKLYSFGNGRLHFFYPKFIRHYPNSLKFRGRFSWNRQLFPFHSSNLEQKYVCVKYNCYAFSSVSLFSFSKMIHLKIFCREHNNIFGFLRVL